VNPTAKPQSASSEKSEKSFAENVRLCAWHEIEELARSLAAGRAQNPDAMKALKALNVTLPVHFVAREIGALWQKVKTQTPFRTAITTGPRGPTEVTPADARPPAPEGIRLSDLLDMDLPEPDFIVPEILPTGLTILAGKPKTGKSWLALETGLAVALGGCALGSDHYRVKAGPVLYLGLEDNDKRMQRRARQQLQGHGRPDAFQFFKTWRRLDDGGLEHLREKIEFYSPRLVVVDTLAHVRPVRTRRHDCYAADCADVGVLKGLADEYDIGVLVIHHLRKATADDVFDTISGTLGLTGSADTILVLQRSRGVADATLSVTGRDIEERELALQFEKTTGSWRALGDAREYAVTCEQRAILDTLGDAGEALALREIARAIDKSEPSVANILNRLMDAGLVRRIGRGRYEPIQEERE